MKDAIRGVFVLLAMLGGCADDGAGEADASPDGRAVVVTTGVIRVTPAGTTREPLEFGAATLTALVPDGAGGYVEHAASGDPASGTMIIAGVPDGEFLLRRDFPGAVQILVVTSASQIDLAGSVLGRNQRLTSGGPPTQLDLEVHGLAPWQAGDVLELYSGSAGSYISEIDVSLPDGATDASLAINWASAGALLIDPAGADETVVFQLEPSDITIGVSSLALVRAAATTAIGVVPDMVTSAAVTLADAPARSLNVSWAPTAWIQAAGMTGPGAILDAVYYDVTVAPGAVANGNIGRGFPDLLLLRANTSAVDVTRSLGYGDPFPAEWDRFVYAAALTRVVYYVNGSGVPIVLNSSIISEIPLSGLSGTVAPTLLPASQLQLDGADAMAPLAGVRATPLVSWTAPATGVADGYEVVFFELSADASSSSVGARVRVFTKRTSVQLPPGTLEAGKTYAILVVAQDEPGDVTRAPFLHALPSHRASVLSAPFTVAP